MKKRLLLVIGLLVFAIHSNAQLVADAGGDKIWCNATLNPVVIHLGATSAAIGGVPPYSYSWTVTDIGASAFPQDAIFYLDSINVPHPRVKAVSAYSDSILAKLTVTDSTGATATDSIIVRFQRNGGLLGYPAISKSATDTIQLINYYHQYLDNFGPDSILYWTPGAYLLDSTAQVPFTFTPHYITYHAIGINRYGCINFNGSYAVVVTPASIGNTPAKDVPKVWLQNGSIITAVDTRLLPAILSLQDGNGKSILQKAVTNEQAGYPVSGLPASVYYYQLKVKSGETYKGKVEVR